MGAGSAPTPPDGPGTAGHRAGPGQVGLTPSRVRSTGEKARGPSMQNGPRAAIEGVTFGVYLVTLCCVRRVALQIPYSSLSKA